MAKTFAEWLEQVDLKVQARCGMSRDDLPDVNYRDMFDQGDSPSTAASYAIRNAKDEVGL